MTLKTAFKSALVAASALTLAACNSADDAAEGGEIAGAPIAEIPAPDGSSWTEIGNETAEGGFVLGNPDAPIKLVEYASHTCGGCAGFAAEGAPIIEEDYVSTGRVSYEIRNLVRDPLDLTIAMAIRCAPAEAFHPIANQAWANLNEIGQAAYSNQDAYRAAVEAPTDQRYLRIAQLAGLPQFLAQRGVSVEQLQTCLADGDKAEAVFQQSNENAEQFNVTRTPTFFINGREVETTRIGDLEDALKAAGAR